MSEKIDFSDETNIDKVLSDLKFITKLEKNTKVILNPRLELIQNTWYNSMYRSFFGVDNRCGILSFTKYTIKQSFNLIDHFKDSNKKSDILICSKIIEDLKLAINGIENIQLVYKSDVKILCDFDLLIQYVNARLLDIITYSDIKNDETLTVNTEQKKIEQKHVEKIEQKHLEKIDELPPPLEDENKHDCDEEKLESTSESTSDFKINDLTKIPLHLQRKQRPGKNISNIILLNGQ